MKKPETQALLSDKEARFVDEYLIDMNASKAAERAGYSKRSAGQIGYELLSRPRVQEALRARQKQLSAEVNITQRRALAEYANIAFFRLHKLFDAEGKLIKPQDLPDEVSAAVSSFRLKTVTVEGKEGTTPLIVTTADVEMHSKLPALRALGEHLGLFDGGVKNPGDLSHLSDEELEERIRAEEAALDLIERSKNGPSRVAVKALKGTAKAK